MRLFFLFSHFFPSLAAVVRARAEKLTDSDHSYLYVDIPSCFFFLPHLLDIFIFINIYQYPCASDAQFMWKMVVLIE